MIIEMKIVNPITYNEDTIELKLEYPIIEYYNWKRLIDYKNDEDICKILDNKLQNLDCTKKYNGKLIRTINDGIYSIVLNEYFYYLVKLTNQFIYNKYFDKLINNHINNVIFNIKESINNDNTKVKYKKNNKIKIPNKFIKYTSRDLFNQKDTYIYENPKTGEKIFSDNPNLLDELNNKSKKKKDKSNVVSMNNLFFDFKKK